MVTLPFFRLHRSQGEGAVAIFPVVDVAEVHFILASEEELMRRRKDRQGAGAGVEDEQTVARPQVDRVGVGS